MRSDTEPNLNTCYEFAGAQWDEISPFESDENRGRAATTICQRISTDCRAPSSDYNSYMRVGTPCEAGATGTCALTTHVRYHYLDSAEMLRMYRHDCDHDGGAWITP